MADNVAITAGSGTTVAADDISSVYYQRVKLSLGADGTAVDAVAGSGVNGTGVQRVTIATDDVIIASLATKLDTIHTDLGTTPSFNAGVNGAAVQRVTIATDDKVNTGVGCSASATFTPAASSHVANDCNGAAGTFALGAPSACAFMITDATLSIAGGTAEATAWRLYLYNVTPPSAIADDGAFDFTVATDGSAFLGYIDLGTAADLGGAQWVETHGINKTVRLAGTSLFGYLVNLTTLTPAAVAHAVTIIGVPV